MHAHMHVAEADAECWRFDVDNLYWSHIASVKHLGLYSMLTHLHVYRVGLLTVEIIRVPCSSLSFPSLPPSPFLPSYSHPLPIS